MNTQRFTPKGEPSVNTGYSRGNDDERTVTNRELSACGSAWPQTHARRCVRV